MVHHLARVVCVGILPVIGIGRGIARVGLMGSTVGPLIPGCARWALAVVAEIHGKIIVSRGLFLRVGRRLELERGRAVSLTLP